ncbi:unnamed protein product [Urochloa decumbens]|uniref:Retrotransposon gag domain-containing protein n=1 Tax=Urochloa decumbens TaxID=240449 RepID=A0ABC8Z7U0_9POAL
MDGYLSNNPKNFVDDPEKLYRQRRYEAQLKKLELGDSIKKEESSSGETPPTTPKGEESKDKMGDVPQLEHTIGELFIPSIADLPLMNLNNIARPFEIKIPTLRMVQNSPFTGKEDANLHIQAFTQLCLTFDMEGVTQDQIRARLFPFSLEGKALQWFYSLSPDTV